MLLCGGWLEGLKYDRSLKRFRMLRSSAEVGSSGNLVKRSE